MHSLIDYATAVLLLGILLWYVFFVPGNHNLLVEKVALVMLIAIVLFVIAAIIVQLCSH